ncbi:MAG TPA: hypothetical protein VFC42_04500 [Methylomirabilota bacterium]|nr:hypothetical protein [Methylomirabilota bacterium]
MRLPAHVLVVVTLIGIGATGCGGPYTLAYVPAGITPLPGLGSLAVHMFVDRRNTEDRRIGTSVFYGTVIRKAEPLYVSEPVAVAVTRAFTDGFTALGFHVVDMAPSRSAAAGESPAETPVSVSGEVIRLAEERIATAGLTGTLRSRAECAVRLRVDRAASGRPAWDTTYWQVDQSARGALARTVSAALNDPELIAHLTGPVR